jgi:parvulin-like peptidyl-prolyl isomerase
LTAKAKAIIAIVVAVAFSLGLIVWQVKAKRAADINITAEDMELIAKDFPPHMLQNLSSSEEARKDLAKNIQDILVLAEEAKVNGLAKRPEIVDEMRLMRAFVIAQLYSKKLQSDGKPPSELATQAEIDALFKEPGKEEKFNQFLKMIEKQGMPSPPPAEQLEQYKKQWATFMIGEKKGTDAGVDKTREAQLQLKLQEAKVLAQNYVNQMSASLKATDEEINAYIAKHPELDPKEARKKAEDVLKRARSGEDFAKLAKDFSIDGSKDQGGDLGWFARGAMVKPFEDAAFALKPGDISDVVESDYGFHIIKVDERRTETKDGKPVEEVKARHILIPLMSQDNANPFAPPQKPKDKARAEIEKEKHEKLFAAARAQHTNVKVASDFNIKAPALPEQMPPANMPPGGGHGPDDGHGHGKAETPKEPEPDKGKQAKPKK